MDPSVELKNLMLRLYESQSSGDVSVVEHFILMRISLHPLTFEKTGASYR